MFRRRPTVPPVVLSAEHANVPAAIEAHLRAEWMAPTYPWYRRWADGHAGRRDRGPRARLQPSTGFQETPPMASSPWIDIIRQEVSAAFARERRDYEALCAIIDARIAEAQSRCGQLGSDAASSAAEEAAHRTEVRPESGAETDFLSATEVATQRAAEDRRAKAALRQRRDSLAAQHAASQHEIAVLEQTRASHLDVVRARCEVIAAYYNRRVARYTRAMERRRRRELYTAPTFSLPEWLQPGTVTFVSDPTERKH